MRIAIRRLARPPYNPLNHCERSILPTFHFAGTLPKLPLPTLEESCEAYIEAMSGLESSKKLTDDDLKKAKSLVADFLSSSGPNLQKILEEENAKAPESSFIWKMWTDMYLKDRR